MSDSEILHEILTLYPEALSDRKRFQALLMDMYPGNKLTVNLIMNAYDCGAPEIDANIDSYNLQLLYSRSVQKLVNDFGLSNEMARYALTIWLDAKGVELKENEGENEFNVDDEFAVVDSKELCVCIGKHNGFDVTQNLAKIPHLFICGRSGSGKTAFVQTIMSKLLFTKPVPAVRFIVFASKGNNYLTFNDTDSLLVDTITKARYVKKVLQWLQTEMRSRYDLLHRKNLKDIYSYNSACEKTGLTLASIFFVIDDFRRVPVDKKTLSLLKEILQKGNLAGIHLIIVTSSNANSKIIKNGLLPSIPGKIAFSLPSASDSQTILGEAGAEELAMPGKMIFQGQNQIVKCDASYFTIENISNMLLVAKRRIANDIHHLDSMNSLDEYLNGKSSKRKSKASPKSTGAKKPSKSNSHAPQKRKTVIPPIPKAPNVLPRRKTKKKSVRGWVIAVFVIWCLFVAVLDSDPSGKTAGTQSATSSASKNSQAFAQGKKASKQTSLNGRPESGTVFIDVFSEKTSEGVFTNNLTKDILIGCYYPKINQTILSFYLRSGETITCKIPYATLEIRVLNADSVADYSQAFEDGGTEYYKLGEKIPFTINSTRQVEISENTIQK